MRILLLQDPLGAAPARYPRLDPRLDLHLDLHLARPPLQVTMLGKNLEAHNHVHHADHPPLLHQGHHQALLLVPYSLGGRH